MTPFNDFYITAYKLTGQQGNEQNSQLTDKYESVIQ